MAAGFKVRPERFTAFQEAFWAHTQGTFGGVPAPQPWILEAELTLNEVQLPLLAELARLEPHGASNPRPQFFLRKARVDSFRVMGEQKNHLALTLSQTGSESIRCVAFGMADRRAEWGQWIDAVVVPRLNEFRGRKSVELELQEARPAHANPC